MNILPVRYARRIASSVIGLVVFVGGLAWWIRLELAELVEERVATSLQVTLDAAAEGVHQQLEGARRAAQAAVDDPRASTAAIECARTGTCTLVWAQLVPYVRAGGFTGLQILDDSHEEVAREPSGRGVPQLNAPLLAQLAALEPMRARVLLPSPETSSKLHAAVALHDASAGRVGTLLFELPMDGVNAVLRAARAGRSGETYAFDRKARMVSESRFAADLDRLGIVTPGAPGALALLELRNPGRDLRSDPSRSADRSAQPLTQLVTRALAGQAGFELEPYRDYRGVLVVGAWTFLSDFEIGIATEADAREVFGALTNIKRRFQWLLSALAVVSTALLAMLAYAAFLQQKLARATAPRNDNAH